MNSRFEALIFLAAILFFGTRTEAQVSYDNWSILLRAQNSIMADSLATFGIRSDATSDFDNGYDVPRPPRAPSGDYLEVYFPHSGGNYPPLLGTNYAVDIQGPVDPTWNFSVETSLGGQVVLSWDSSYVNSIDPRVQLFLYDAAGHMFVNMRTVGNYTWNYTVKRDFQIVGAVKINVKYLMEGFWNGTTQVSDTIHGYLAASSSPFAFVDSVSVFLSTSGTGMLVFANAATGSYYLVVRHRNHLEIWTSNPLSLINGTTSVSDFDFSADLSKTYGTNPLKQVGSVYVSWGGDVNQDGIVDFLDRNLTWNERGLDGYRPTDCDGDNSVNSNDYTIVLNDRLKIRQRP